MKGRAWFHAWRWSRSVHAKLFTLTGLLTTALTLLVAYAIIGNARREMMDYTRSLALQTASMVASQIQEHDPDLRNPDKIQAFLESLAGTDKSIDQIDVFHRTPEKALAISSAGETEAVWTPDLEQDLRTGTPQTRLIEFLPSEGESQNSSGWEVRVPIPNPRPGQPPEGLVRTYCDMERWEIVWKRNLQRTYWILPLVLLGEFAVLWLMLAWLLDRPLKAITTAMVRLENGDAAARAQVPRSDELGRIAARFNAMATQLEKATAEREELILEIRGMNAGLQARIEEALAELQAKNQALEALLKRIALLRGELAQQERLAVAGQLTAAFAHEVGTPLNLVDSHLQILLAQKDLGTRTREPLATIHAQINRVGDIVRRLLASTRRPDIQPEPVPLRELVSDLIRLWGPAMEGRGISFSESIPEGCVLVADRKQMEQLFINLVNNALDAMPHGGQIHLEACHDAASPETKPRWLVSLQDTGTGIPAEVLPMVFKSMFTTKPEGKGTGLGLAICREIVRAHGGELRIQSTEGVGTTLRFSLPGV